MSVRVVMQPPFECNLRQAKFGACLLAFLFVSVAPNSAQQSEIASLSRSLTRGALKAKSPQHQKVRVAIFTFYRQDGEVTELGAKLTQEIARELLRSSEIELVTRDEMNQARKGAGWTQEEWSMESIGYALAKAAGAEVAIVGAHEKAKDKIRVEARAVRLPKGSKLSSATLRIPLPPEWRALDTMSIPGVTAKEHETTSSFAENARRKGALKPGFDGVSEPRCQYCPDPPFTKQARDNNYSAKVLLAVIIDEIGMPTDIQVARSARYGLTEQAIHALHTWKFKPAMKDGKPVPVIVYVEITFKLL